MRRTLRRRLAMRRGSWSSATSASSIARQIVPSDCRTCSPIWLHSNEPTVNSTRWNGGGCCQGLLNRGAAFFLFEHILPIRTLIHRQVEQRELYPVKSCKSKNISTLGIKVSRQLLYCGVVLVHGPRKS